MLPTDLVSGATGALVWLAIALLLACTIGAAVFFCARRVDAYAPADRWPADGIDTSAELAGADLEVMRDRVDQLLNLPPEYVRRFDRQPCRIARAGDLMQDEIERFIPLAQPRRCSHLGKNDRRPQA